MRKAICNAPNVAELVKLATRVLNSTSIYGRRSKHLDVRIYLTQQNYTSFCFMYRSISNSGKVGCEIIVIIVVDTFYRAMLCIRGTSRGSVSVCLCLCLSQVGVLLKRLNDRAGFWHVSFLPPVLHCVKRIFGYLQK